MGRYSTRAALLPMLLAVALPGGCGAQHESPADALSSALEAANTGDYDTLESYYSDAMHREARGGMLVLLGGSDGLSEFYTRGGELEDVEVTGEEIRDGRARVEATLHYQSGIDPWSWNYGSGEAAEDSVWDMVLEDGTWKLTPHGIA